MPLRAPSTPASGAVDADLDLDRNELLAKLADAELMAKVHRAVEAIARVPRGSLIARELVAEAIDDMYSGKLPWDPKRSFQEHVVDEARRQFQRSARKQRNHISLDALGDQDARLIDRAGEPEPQRGTAMHRERIALARQHLSSQRDLAALQLLTFYELGVTRRRDLRRLGLSGWTYRAAYNRLWELFARLDAVQTQETERA